jgi:hypothetical protein
MRSVSPIFVMYIRTLALQNFRSYEGCSVDFGAGVNILTGRNGAAHSRAAVHAYAVVSHYSVQWIPLGMSMPKGRRAAAPLYVHAVISSHNSIIAPSGVGHQLTGCVRFIYTKSLDG